MNEPRIWNVDELRAEAKKAREVFRWERTGEPLEKYVAEFDAAKEQFEKLFTQHRLAEIGGFTGEDVGAIAKQKLLAALRYCAGPPISSDDLKTVADVQSLAPTRLANNVEAAAKVLAVIKTTLDPRRFPWVVEGRAPRGDEQRIAIFASAALAAGQKIASARRASATKQQEGAVKSALAGIGFTIAKRRTVQLLHQGPAVGELCAESKVGPTRADVVVRLYDERLMLIECKASNSEVNSFKRVNHEAGGKAEKWIGHFGKQIVPSAVLSGVYKAEDLLAAQDTGLRLFWTHDLNELCRFVESTKA